MMKFIHRIFRYVYNIYVFFVYRGNKNVTLISNNCIAGFIYHAVGQKFNSPTVNLQIAPSDFVKFITNMDYYLGKELIEVKNPDINGFKKLGGTDISFPVGQLGDITIYFQHYQNFADAKRKWEKRANRIIRDKIILLLVDTFCDKDTIEAYSKVPHEKYFLSNDADKAEWLENGVFIKYDSAECTDWHEVVRGSTGTRDLWGRRYFEKTEILRSIFLK